LQRTAKSCGPDAPTLASSSRSRVGPTGLRQNISVGDGGKQARSPGRARRKPLKPLRAGTSGDSGVLVVTRVRSTNTKCTRGRGCNGHPAFPTPSLGGRAKQRLGRIASRGRSRVGNERNVIGPSSDPIRPAGTQADGARPWSAASATGAPFSAGYAPVSAARAGPLQNRHFFAANRLAHVISPPPAASRPDLMLF
jgi:hypothetical protein